jgi:hypothetical protein
MPEVRVGGEIIPFTLVSRRDRVANVTAERLSTRVMDRTLPAAIQRGNRGIKAVIQFSNIGMLKRGNGFHHSHDSGDCNRN